MITEETRLQAEKIGPIAPYLVSVIPSIEPLITDEYGTQSYTASKVIALDLPDELLQ
jgi:hypothetical protein